MAEFGIDIEGAISLTVDQIWPEGDAPENPTTADVVKRIKDYGTLPTVITDWYLPVTLSVDGVEALDYAEP